MIDEGDSRMQKFSGMATHKCGSSDQLSIPPITHPVMSYLACTMAKLPVDAMDDGYCVDCLGCEKSHQLTAETAITTRTQSSAPTRTAAWRGILLRTLSSELV